ncbi:hypothetical protein, partial [Klebsiella sp. HMSC09D12]|uniref:hypothetical protein n=1 Tax=Klebsiella sp. HMSC09D12 TaxID=1581146 RepID=UPI001C30B554
PGQAQRAASGNAQPRIRIRIHIFYMSNGDRPWRLCYHSQPLERPFLTRVNDPRCPLSAE